MRKVLIGLLFLSTGLSAQTFDFSCIPCDYNLPGASGVEIGAITFDLPFAASSFPHNELAENSGVMYQWFLRRGYTTVRESVFEGATLEEIKRLIFNNLVYGDYSFSIQPVFSRTSSDAVPYGRGAINFTLDSCRRKEIDIIVNVAYSNLLTFYTNTPSTNFGLRGYGGRTRSGAYCSRLDQPNSACLQDTKTIYDIDINGTTIKYLYIRNSTSYRYFLTVSGPIGQQIPTGASFDSNYSRIELPRARVGGTSNKGNHYHYTYEYTWVYDYPIPPDTNDEITETEFNF